jgi:hypothetical protein
VANNRIFYAVQAVGIAPESTTTFVALRGVQSVGINTTFNLEQVFELGMISIYQNIENIPDIEVTMEKSLDGHPLIYHRATQNAADATLVGRSAKRCNMALSVFTDTQQAASGTPVAQCYVSGCFVNAVSYRVQTDGNAIESVTLVANNKRWLTSAFTFTGGFTPTGVPLAAEGVNRRQHVDMGTSLWPTIIPGISSSGTNDKTGDVYGAHLQSANLSVNLNREQLLELGRRGPYFRFVQFPVETTAEITITASSGDNVGATEDGVLGGGNNLSNERIYVAFTEGTKVDLGTRNKLASVNYTGGDAGNQGGNVTVTYNFQGYNDFTVTHPQDPTVGLAA